MALTSVPRSGHLISPRVYDFLLPSQLPSAYSACYRNFVVPLMLLSRLLVAVRGCHRLVLDGGLQVLLHLLLHRSTGTSTSIAAKPRWSTFTSAGTFWTGVYLSRI